MPRDNAVKVKLFCTANELFKFDKAVAVNARIRCCTVFIGSDKAVDYIFLKAVLEVIDIVGNAELEANSPCIINVIKRTTGFFSLFTDIFVIKELEGNARCVISHILGKKCGNRAVNSSAHCNQCFVSHLFLPNRFAFISNLSAESDHFVNALSCVCDSLIVKLDFFSAVAVKAVVNINKCC